MAIFSGIQAPARLLCKVYKIGDIDKTDDLNDFAQSAKLSTTKAQKPHGRSGGENTKTGKYIMPVIMAKLDTMGVYKLYV